MRKISEEIIKNFFRKRSPKYNKFGIWVKDLSVLDMTLEFMEINETMKLIDVGAGTGFVLKYVLNTFPNIQECVALDITLEMLDKINDLRIMKCLHDAHNIPFPSNHFDVAVCRQSLHYMNNLNKVMQEIRRILTPKGALVIGQITPYNEKDEKYWKKIIKTRNPIRKHLLLLDDLISLLKANSFKIVRVSQIKVKESLEIWLKRYKISDNQINEVRKLIYTAPSIYKRIHNFRKANEDIVFKNCWSFIRAIKK